MADQGLAGWEYTRSAEYKVIDTHVHIWETDGVMSAITASSKNTGVHQNPDLRTVPPRWASEPTDSGRVELLLDDMHQNLVDGAVVVQTSFSTWDNEYVAASALRFPERLRSMGMVDPLDPGKSSKSSRLVIFHSTAKAWGSKKVVQGT